MNAFVYAILSDHTCGEACWYAKEDVCRCACGGKNHGVLRTGEGLQPIRTAKIDGYHYELLAVGERSDLWPECNRLLKDLPPYREEIIKGGPHYRYRWQETDKGSPIRMKYATPIQCEKWHELQAYKGLSVQEFRLKNICLLWKRV